MIELEEIEDEGVAYLFQVESKKIFYLWGQEYYEISNFPNTDFEVVHILGKNGDLVEFYVHCMGKKLKPTRIINSKVKEKYLEKLDQLPELFDGDIDNIDEVLR